MVVVWVSWVCSCRGVLVVWWVFVCSWLWVYEGGVVVGVVVSCSCVWVVVVSRGGVGVRGVLRCFCRCKVC